MADLTPASRRNDAACDNSQNLRIAAMEDVWAGLRLCMVMHVGNSGGFRTWHGWLGRRPDWGIGTPRSTGVRKGSVTDDR